MICAAHGRIEQSGAAAVGSIERERKGGQEERDATGAAAKRRKVLTSVNAVSVDAAVPSQPSVWGPFCHVKEPARRA